MAAEPRGSGGAERPSARLLTGSILAGAGVVAAATVLARVAGVGRWFVFSNAVGVTCTGQVYATTNQIPNVLFEIAAGGALAAVVVPLVAGHLNRGRDVEADRAASAMLTWTVTLGIPLTLLLILFAEPIAAALLAGDPRHDTCGDAVRTGAMMLVIFAPQILLYGIGIVLAGVLQAHRRFLAAALAPLASSLVVIAVYLIYRGWVSPGTPLGQTPSGALWWLAGGTTAGVVALSLPLFLPVARAGVRWRPTWRFPAGSGRRAGALAVAGLLAVGAQQLCVLATIWLSNRADGVGVLNVYTYTQTIYLLPYAVLVVPLATVAFPRLTDTRGAEVVLARTGQAVLAVGVLGAGLLVLARREIGVFFEVIDAGSGGPGQATLAELPTAVAAYAPGLIGFALVALLTRALYARGSARTAGVAAGLGWLLAAAVPLLVLVGAGTRDVGTTLLVLGLSSSLGMTASAVMLALSVRASWGAEVLRGWFAVGTSAIAGVGLIILVRELVALAWAPQGLLSAVLSGVLTAVVATLAVLLVLRWVVPDAADQVLSRLRRREGPPTASAQEGVGGSTHD